VTFAVDPLTELDGFVSIIVDDDDADPAVIANVGPATLEPLIKFRRSATDKELVSDSFLPVNSLIND
jgi:hypothetical protein